MKIMFIFHLYLSKYTPKKQMCVFPWISNFVKDICGCLGDWSVTAYLEAAIEEIQNRAGDGFAICPMTGGVDSATCAALTYRALGERALYVLIDTGLLSRGEGESIERVFVEEMNIPMLRVQAADRFLKRLQWIIDPAQKRRIVAEEYSTALVERGRDYENREVFLIRATIYNDIIEGAISLATAGAPESWTILDPLRGLFKHEIRELGALLGLPEHIVNRQSFPSAGLAVRCLGEVTSARIEQLREADAIYKQVLETSGVNKGLQQYFAVLIGVPVLDANGGIGGETIVLRAVQQRHTGRMQATRLSFDILESATERILAKVSGVTRILYDLSPCPPAAVEWE